jgi:hypothetical protein
VEGFITWHPMFIAVGDPEMTMTEEELQRKRSREEMLEDFIVSLRIP